MVARKRKLPYFRYECEGGPRPCPLVSCRHHLWPTKNGEAPWELEESCVLDLAKRGEMSYTEIGKVLGFTQQRVQQIGSGAAKKLAEAIKELGWDELISSEGHLVSIYRDADGRQRVCNKPEREPNTEVKDKLGDW